MFGNKSKNSHHKKNQKDYNLFPISRPWGYYPDDVHKKILSYENALKLLNQSITKERTAFSTYKATAEKELEEKDEIIQQKDNIIESLKEELRQMHLQMSNIELPEADYGVSYAVLDQFKNYNNGVQTSNKYADESKRKNNKGSNTKELMSDGKTINIVK